MSSRLNICNNNKLIAIRTHEKTENEIIEIFKISKINENYLYKSNNLLFTEIFLFKEECSVFVEENKLNILNPKLFNDYENKIEEINSRANSIEEKYRSFCKEIHNSYLLAKYIKLNFLNNNIDKENNMFLIDKDINNAIKNSINCFEENRCCEGYKHLYYAKRLLKQNNTEYLLNEDYIYNLDNFNSIQWLQDEQKITNHWYLNELKGKIAYIKKEVQESLPLDKFEKDIFRDEAVGIINKLNDFTENSSKVLALDDNEKNDLNSDVEIQIEKIINIFEKEQSNDSWKLIFKKILNVIGIYKASEKWLKHSKSDNSNNNANNLYDDQKGIFMFWKQNMNYKNMISMVPFVRNIIEYTTWKKENTDLDALTNLLHENLDNIINNNDNYVNKNFNDLEEIYKKYIKGLKLPNNLYKSLNVLDELYEQSEYIVNNYEQSEYIFVDDLQNKLILAMAIRHKAEIYMINKIKEQNKPDKWTEILNKIKKEANNQTRKLYEKVKMLVDKDTLKTLDAVNIMTAENIHFNSFMYEPLIDMDICNLVSLYKRIDNLLK
ncbi:hypothetical protein [Ureaplasma ceti]|uniref:hypothetical protein n=1 Tax=Ureaplasma ceti TaxID=3119530 RepID=UPI0033427475